MKTTTAQTIPGAPQQPRLALAILALLFIIYNAGSLFYILRGAPAGQLPLALPGYFAGLLLAALGMDVFIRRLATARGRERTVLLAVFFLFLLLPGAFCLVSFQITGYSGTLLTNTIHLTLWSFPLPVALRLFFLHTASHDQPLQYSVAVGAGHLCWALLIPLTWFSGTAVGLDAGGPESRVLPFLNFTRCLACALLALLSFRLVSAGIPVLPRRPKTESFPANAFGCFWLPLYAAYLWAALPTIYSSRGRAASGSTRNTCIWP